eukprot:m.42225 g.42225  ORF g.42225 m.42225 type:complete len:811 (+) comp10493_c0_seq1:78-2510(+)
MSSRKSLEREESLTGENELSSVAENNKRTSTSSTASTSSKKKQLSRKQTSYFYRGDGKNTNKTIAKMGRRHSNLQRMATLILAEEDEVEEDDNNLQFSSGNLDRTALNDIIEENEEEQEQEKEGDEFEEESVKLFRSRRMTTPFLNSTEHQAVDNTKLQLHLEEVRGIDEDPEMVASQVDFKRITIDGDDSDRFEAPETGHILLSAVTLRKKYMKKSLQPVSSLVTKIKKELQQHKDKSKGLRGHRLPTLRDMNQNPLYKILNKSETLSFDMRQGVVNVSFNGDSVLAPSISVDRYLDDLNFILSLISDGPTKSFCHQRIKLLMEKFKIHVMVNLQAEIAEQKRTKTRDFYTIPKVDTHIHLSACMHQRHLLEFIKRKAREHGDEEVIVRDGKTLTLTEVFESIQTDPEKMTLDALDVHADVGTFHRFDKFNLKYNPLGESRLREIFLKTSNMVGGHYFGELTREVIDKVEASSEEYAEYRVSVYGRSRDEFSKLAKWFVGNKLASKNIRWLIQVPRIYQVYRKKNMIGNFEEMLENVFMPLFEITNNPESDPDLATFLEHVTAFDSVDDESKPEPIPHGRNQTPDKWDSTANPPYSAYVYYMYANISVLNKFRAARGLNTFNLRPHAGEAGSPEHLACTFLLADSIAHGIELRKVPVLQYLYYLSRIGMSVSPLSNNSLFLDYFKIPFLEFHQLGLNVTLSTDDPMQFHLTSNPLIEEYSIASQVWKLSQVDLSEIAHNSGMISGFEEHVKREWYGEHYDNPTLKGNDPRLTNIPQIRAAFRHECLVNEVELLMKGGLDAAEGSIASFL